MNESSQKHEQQLFIKRPGPLTRRQSKRFVFQVFGLVRFLGPVLGQIWQFEAKTHRFLASPTPGIQHPLNIAQITQHQSKYGRFREKGPRNCFSKSQG